MAQIIKTTGEVIEVAPKNGTDFSLEELQTIVGGWIEIVNLRDGRLLCLDEEGKLKGKERNYVATDIYHQALPLCCKDFIVGDVLLCNEDQID
jgi:hypothetical protein